ncbi:MAG: 2-hydroxyacid dehydrogenase [Candidatus Thermoplasmatota archaeon]
MKVLHLDPFKKVFKEEREISLEDLAPSDVEVIDLSSGDEDKVMDRADEFDAVIGAGVEREFLEKAENLKYYIVPFVGIPETDRENLSDFPDITVINSHFNYWMVAEHAFALLLACAKKLVPIHKKLKEGDWTPRYENERGWGFRNKNLLILGFGEIGKEIAKVANSFEMEVNAVKNTPGDSDLVEKLGTNEDLHDLLSDADFIICTLPETEETKGYLGKEEFDQMKEGVLIVNVGRGPVIDEEAFYEALKSGKVKGAGIDTWWVYPPDEESRDDTSPSNYPLDEFDNVVFSPHRATQIKERGEYRIKDLAEILGSLAEGKEVNVVDIDRGY